MDTQHTEQATGEQHVFATEVQQILHLMIHSLYSKREVFLRELISNASDALDTVRFLALTNPELRASQEPSIEITLDPEARTISISDDGIGMTREQVTSHIGTIARSGSGELLRRLREQGGASSPELIGQFGVGFYSSFMVADRVELTTLSAQAGAEAVRWSSSGGGTYTLHPASRPHPGTTVTLHLKADADEFLKEERIEEVVRAYSNYVKWPIRLRGKTLNQTTALWARRPADVTEEEHRRFYQELTGGFGDDEPLCRLHLSMDAPYQFQALLYVPGRAPFDFLMDSTKRRGVQLYVKRVFILDHAEELLPPYLRFLRGVVDSDDLPLNVSREILQKNQIISTIQKQIIKKTLEELKRLKAEKRDTYLKFWEEFGPILKEGIVTDRQNQDKIADLLLYQTRKGEPGALSSLSDYVAAMPEEQKEIYYITGPNRELVASSPHLEALTQRGFDVLFLIEPIDEWVAQGLTEFQGKRLRSVAKGELDLPPLKGEAGPDKDKDKDQGAADKDRDKDQAGATGQAGDADAELLIGNLVTALRVRFQEAVSEVRISNRLTQSPSCLVYAQGDLGRNLEQILIRGGRKVTEARPILEINPASPFVRALARKVKERPHAEEVGALSDLLLDMAYLAQGAVRKPAALVQTLTKLLERDPDRLGS
jgi:molecular chaperone HtpG